MFDNFNKELQKAFSGYVDLDIEAILNHYKQYVEIREYPVEFE